MGKEGHVTVKGVYGRGGACNYNGYIWAFHVIFSFVHFISSDNLSERGM